MGTSTTSLKGINLKALRNGKQQDSEDAHNLIRPITESEVRKALFGIRNHKALGIDGFNSVFFKKAWAIVKDDFFEVVSDFFES